MAAKLYSPVYSPGMIAKNPEKIYDTLAKCRIALLPKHLARHGHSAGVPLPAHLVIIILLEIKSETRNVNHGVDIRRHRGSTATARELPARLLGEVLG